MYLTKMHLNPARRGTRKLAGSPQAMHAAVLAGFPPAVHQGSRPLWRLESQPDLVTLYVSSRERPDFTHLIEQAGWPTGGEAWQSASTDEMWGRLGVGQRWRFRLTANPVKSLSAGQGRRGKVTSLRKVADQERWLLERAEPSGFEIPTNSLGARELAISAGAVDRFERRTDGVARTVVVNRATFDGILVVIDPERLRVVLREGIGRAKAYGCGLLTLAQV